MADMHLDDNIEWYNEIQFAYTLRPIAMTNGQ